jgi:hypothetical protein
MNPRKCEKDLFSNGNTDCGWNRNLHTHPFFTGPFAALALDTGQLAHYVAPDTGARYSHGGTMPVCLLASRPERSRAGNRVIMELLQVTYQGPPVDDPELFELLPPELRALLEQINGFVQFGGGLHIRGASRDPDWHSLRRVWMSDHAFHTYYRSMGATDIPFGQDYLGNQFLLRNGLVALMEAELGHITELNLTLPDFIEAVQADPNTTLNLEPLWAFQQDNAPLEPGELLHADPPLCSDQAMTGYTLTRKPAVQHLADLRSYYTKIKVMSDTGRINAKKGE